MPCNLNHLSSSIMPSLLTPRFLINNKPPYALKLGEWVIDDKILYNHLAAVRVRVGQDIALIDDTGTEWNAKIIKIEKKIIICDIFYKKTMQEKYYIQKQYIYQEHIYSVILDVTLLIGAIAQQNFDFLLQKATELGVQDIILLNTQYSQHLPAERIPHKMIHWKNILQHACEQSGRNHLPVLKVSQNIKAYLQSLNLNVEDAKNYDVEHNFIFLIPKNTQNILQVEESKYANTEPATTARALAGEVNTAVMPRFNYFSSQTINDIISNCLEQNSPNNKICKKYIHLKLNAYIGPEGGFSDEEELLFNDFIREKSNISNLPIHSSANFYSLGQQILRSETAAISFLSTCYLL